MVWIWYFSTFPVENLQMTAEFLPLTGILWYEERKNISNIFIYIFIFYAIKKVTKSNWKIKTNFVAFSEKLNFIRKFRKVLTIMHSFSHMFQHSGTQNEIATKNYVKRLLLLWRHFRFRSQRTGSQLILIVLARDFRGFFRKKFADVADRIKASPQLGV